MPHISTESLWDLGHFNLTEIRSLTKANKEPCPNHSDFLKLIKSRGITGVVNVLYVELRNRDYIQRHYSGSLGNAAEWHKDSFLADIYLGVWCGSNPTQIREHNRGDIFTLKRQNLYLMKNRAWWHRPPPDYDPTLQERTFLRFSVYYK